MSSVPNKNAVVVGLLLGAAIFGSGLIFGLVQAGEAGFSLRSLIPLLVPLLVCLGFLRAAKIFAFRGTKNDVGDKQP